MFSALPQFVPQDVCLSCDGCCRFKETASEWRPKIVRDEIKTGLAEEIFFKEIDRDGYIKAVSCQGHAQCVFFHAKDNTCGAYQHRPFECRLYPFLLIKNSRGASVCVHLHCPYIREKKDLPEFTKYVDELREYFHNKDILEFIEKNQTLLGSYPDYQDEIVHVFDLPVTV